MPLESGTEQMFAKYQISKEILLEIPVKMPYKLCMNFIHNITNSA